MARRRNRWPELCKRVADDDGLPCREVGAWTVDKLFNWNRYIEMTTNAVTDKWPDGLVYVDLFGGPGICRLRESRQRFPGSVLLAAMAPKPFSLLLICEKNPRHAQACHSRLTAIGAAGRSKLFVGDCNAEIGKIVREIPAGALTLAFIDPEGLHVHFDTLRILTRDRRVDLAILVADHMDIVRNVATYARQKDSNLDRFLGTGTRWRQKWSSMPNQDAEHTCQLFTDIFQDQLRRCLGYRFTDACPFKSSHGTLYRVIRASKHELGQKFSLESYRIDRGGQMELFGPAD